MKLLAGILLSIILYTSLIAGPGPQAGTPYVLFEENGKAGLKNEAGTVLIPAEYEALGWSEGPLAPASTVIGYKLNGQWGLVDLHNKRITPAIYVALSRGNENLIIASKRSTTTLRITTGCINSAGKEIIPFQYTAISLLDLRAVVCMLDGGHFRYGLIDLANHVLIPMQYRTITALGSLRYAVENFDGKTALFNENGKPLTSFDMDSVASFQNNRAIFYQNGLQGIINRDGVRLHPAIYKTITLTGSQLMAQRPDQWLVLSTQNQVLDTIQADSLVPITPARFKRVNGNTTWLLDASFKPLQGPFQQLGMFQHALAMARNNQLLGVVNINGEPILPFQFNEIRMAGNYLYARTTIQGKTNWHVYDHTGTRISRTHYDQLLAPATDLIPVRKRGYWGALDATGKEVIACVYDSILDVRANQVLVKFKGQYGILNVHEEWLVTPQPSTLRLIHDHRYLLTTGDLVYLKGFNGNIYYFTNNHLTVTDAGLVEHTSAGATWMINYDGQIVQRQEAPAEPSEKVYPEREGLRAIRRNGRYGFIDDRGRLRIANRYEDVQAFQEGLAAVKIRGKWGFINREEHLVIQPTYEEVSPFVNGFALVRQKGKFGLLQATGTLVLPARYDSVNILNNGWLLLKQDEQYGLADAKGNIILQLKFDQITVAAENQFIVKQFGKFGMINDRGISIIPLHYDELEFDTTGQRYFARIHPDPVLLP